MKMDDDDFTAKQHGKDNGRDKDLRQEYERWQGLESETLELELDKALARYAAIEPRMGLEDRVLANLRAEPKLAPPHAWWRWTAVAALAAVLLVAFTFVWRSGERRKDRDNVARDPSPAPARATPDRVSSGCRWQHIAEAARAQPRIWCPSRSPEQTTRGPRRPWWLPGQSWISFLRRGL